MQYRLLILNDSFEEEVVEFIHSSMQLRGVPNDQAEYDCRFDAFRGLLHMHWLGMCSIQGIPNHLDEPKYHEEIIDVQHFDHIEFPVVGNIPLVLWKGEIIPVTEIRQILAATALQEDAPDMAVYSPYTIVTEYAIANDTMLKAHVDAVFSKLRATEANLNLGVVLRSGMGGTDKWKLN